MASSQRSAQIAGDGQRSSPLVENLILSLLPAEERAVIFENTHKVSHDLRDLLFEFRDAIEHVYFPVGGMASLITKLSDGSSIEAMTVGLEGFVGLPLFHGVRVHRSRGTCQIDGDFLSMSAEKFTELLPKLPALNSLLHRYAQFANEVLTQSTACNATHLIEQRCARWLLTTGDSIGQTKFRLTQEFLAQMLAVRRPGVTVAMGALVRQGLIVHTYGVVDLVDIDGLKQAACECYQAIHTAQQELLVLATPANA